MTRINSGVRGLVVGMLTAIVLASAGPRAQAPTSTIEIAGDAARSFSSADGRGFRSMQRRFTERDQPPSAAPAAAASTCPRTVPGSVRRRTLADVLGPDVTLIVVREYLNEWRDVPTVAGYIRRILATESEWWPFQVWSNVTAVEIDASVDTRGGGRRAIEFGNGYAHAVDASGCEWWAGFAGLNRSTIIDQ